LTFRKNHLINSFSSRYNQYRKFFKNNIRYLLFITRFYFLKKFVFKAKDGINCVAATTMEEYQKHIQKDSVFENCFHPVLVEEITIADCLSVLRGIKVNYEYNFKGTTDLFLILLNYIWLKFSIQH
jgi:hypothetical protein